MRILVALVFALCSAIGTAPPARANTCTVPNSLSNGSVVDANGLNTNFIALQSCGNNIDSTNIGPAGILASQIISNSAAAGTFGGTANYSFPAGLTVAGNTTLTNGVLSAATSIPLQLCSNGNCATTALTIGTTGIVVSTSTIMPGNGQVAAPAGAALLLCPNNNCAVPFTLTTGGNAVSSANFVSNNGAFLSAAGQPAQLCANANCATTGLTINTTGTVVSVSTITPGNGNIAAPAGTALNLCPNNNCATALTVTTGGNVVSYGQVAGSKTTGGLSSYFPVVYTNGGAAVVATEHVVPFNYTSTTTATCATNAVCPMAVSVVSFTGIAAFTSGTSYYCGSASLDSYSTKTVITKAAGSVTFGFVNIGSVTIPSGSAFTDDGVCIGG